MRVRRARPLALALLAGCAGNGPPPPVANGPLPPGVVARVGEREVAADAVLRIARAQGLAADRARDAAVHDTLLAAGAERAGLAASPEARSALTAALARRMLQGVLADARTKPATEAELEEAAARHWLEVDRPEGFRTIHAVVRFDPSDAAAKERGLALAATLRAAELPVSERAASLPLPEGAPASGPRTAPNDDPDELSAAFRRAVAGVPSGELEVRVEILPPVTASGRVLEPGDQYLEPSFAQAAAALPARGALSPVVTTPYGAHVVMLLERTPAAGLGPEARRARLGDFVAYERAVVAERRLLSGLRGRASVAPEADALLSLVRVDP